jgi:hypothetical protein
LPTRTATEFLRALEVATLFALRRALCNGSVWIEHSLSFRGGERLFLPDECWRAEARRHHARLQLPAKASDFLAPLLERVRAESTAVADARQNQDIDGSSMAVELLPDPT